jgi:predicted nucleotidyltransferase
MKRAAALAILKAHAAELHDLGVLSLSLIGSMARDDATDRSDVDVAVELEDSPSGFATLGRLDRIRHRLSEILGTPVDVVPEPVEPSPLKRAIDRDRCRAF